jgi:hypothetical protein
MPAIVDLEHKAYGVLVLLVLRSVGICCAVVACPSAGTALSIPLLADSASLPLTMQAR